MPNINDFKAKLAGGGARANQFKVAMPFPGYAQVGGEIEDLAFLAQATAIPAMTVGNYQCVNLEVEMSKLLEIEHLSWSVTVINDTDLN